MRMIPTRNNLVSIAPTSILLTGILLGILSVSSPAVAAEPGQKPAESGQKPGQDRKPQYWTLQYDLEYRKNSGNTRSYDLRTGINVAMKRLKDDLRLTASYAKGKTSDEVSVDRRDFLTKYNHLIIKKAYVTAFLFYEQDSIRDIARRFQIGPTFGCRFYDTPKLFFSSDAGAILDETKNESNDNESGNTESELKGLWNIDFSYEPVTDLKFEERVRWTQYLRRSDFEVTSETSAYVPLYKRLFLKISLTDHYNTRPDPDYTKNDLTVITSLSYIIHF